MISAEEFKSNLFSAILLVATSVSGRYELEIFVIVTGGIVYKMCVARDSDVFMAVDTLRVDEAIFP